MPLKLVRNDITKMHVHAVVNAANTALKMGGGVCGAIFEAAGAEILQSECDRIGGCGVGEAVITSGCRLPARYIIHTVGPVWRGGGHGEERMLHSCYINSLRLALKHECRSIAFPLISSGTYGYPKDQALHVAISAISSFLLENEMDVYLVIFDKTALAISEKLFSAVEKYIDDNYAEVHLMSEFRRSIQEYEYEYKNVHDGTSADMVFSFASPVKESTRDLNDVLTHLDETFSEMLLRLIDEKGYTDVMTYKRANIDRKLFSKIRSNKNYNPSKQTAVAFAIALELNLDQTLDLLKKAGYTLSHSSKFDVIIEYFIKEQNYDIYEINQTLFAFDQSTLGA